MEMAFEITTVLELVMVLKIPATLEMTTILERTELFLIRAQPHSTCRFRTALSGYREHSTDEELPSCSIIVMLHSCTGPCQTYKGSNWWAVNPK
jgi:hypothetical protein